MAEGTIPPGSNFTRTTHHDTYPAINPASNSDFSGRYVFISGASKGIGRAIAISYSRAGAAGIGIGARSDLSSLQNEIYDAAKQAGKDTPKVLAVELDVADRATVESAAKEVETSFGRLDILVNNAGYMAQAVPIADSDPDEWWKTWTVNIRGPYLMTRSFLPLMLKPGGDKQIVNVSSVGAHVTTPGLSSYQNGKLAILRFSESINAEYGDRGVVAFSVHPGGVNTALAQRMPGELQHALVDTPELAGDSVVYLTRRKQEWLAGRYVSVNWDMEELFEMRDEVVERDALKVRLVV